MRLNDVKEKLGSLTRKENFEGGEAFRPASPELGLYKVVINNFLEDKFYESADESLEKIRDRLDEAAGEDPAFPVNLAVYARNEMHLRDLPQLLLVLSANDERTKPFVRDLGAGAIQRPDDACTAVAAQLKLFGKPVPKPLRAAVTEALHGFDAYQLAKYRMGRREVSLVDVFNLVHPEPRNDETEELWRRFVYGDLSDHPEVEPLEPPRTWEVELTVAVEEAIPERYAEARNRWKEENVDDLVETYGPDFNRKSLSSEKMFLDLGGDPEDLFGTGMSIDDLQGIKDEARAEGFRTLVPRIGMFARVRNIRNMLDAGLEPEEFLREEDLQYVEGSKMYPFRFYQAYRALKDDGLDNSHVERWLERAVEASAGNLSTTLENSYVAVDLSGSMDIRLSRNSSVTYREIAALLGAVLMKNGADAGAFAENYSDVGAHVDTPVLELTQRIMDAEVGRMSTNGWKAVKHLRKKERRYDRIVMLTDEQIWDSTMWDSDNTVRKEFLKYRKKVGPETRLYMLDLSSYGDLTMPEGHPGVYSLSGWNKRVLDLMHHVENQNQVIEEIGSG